MATPPPPGAGPQQPGLVDPAGNPLRAAEVAQQQRDLEIRAKILRAQEDYDKQLQRSVQTLRRGGMSYEEIAKSMGSSEKETSDLVAQMKAWNTVTIRSVKDLKELVSMPIGEIFDRVKEGTLKFAYSAQLSVGMLVTAGKKIFEVFERGALTVNRTGSILAAQGGVGVEGSGFGAVGSGLTDFALRAQIREATVGLTAAHLPGFDSAVGQIATMGMRFLGPSQTVAAAAKATELAPGLGLDPTQAARIFGSIMMKTGSSVEETSQRFKQMDRQAQVGQMSNGAYFDSVEKLVDLTYQHGVSVDTATKLVSAFGRELTLQKVKIGDIAQFATGIEGQSPQHRTGLALLAKQMGVGGTGGLPSDPLAMMRVLRESAANGHPVMGFAQSSQMALKMATQMGRSFDDVAELVVPQVFGSLPTEAKARQAMIDAIKGGGELRTGGSGVSSLPIPDVEKQSRAVADMNTSILKGLADVFTAAKIQITESIREGFQNPTAGPPVRRIADLTPESAKRSWD